ncbi:hypothetical protein pb186bvf_007688 [Paramecium bursaria]
MINISDLKTDLQAKFEAVDELKVPQKYISDLHRTIKTLTKLLNIRIRTDMPNLSANQFNETMNELLKIIKQFNVTLRQRQNEQLQETTRQNELEKRIIFLEQHTSAQLKDLQEQNSMLQLKAEDYLKYKEEYENYGLKSKELELEIKKLKHEKDSLKSQNTNLTSLVRQLKEEKSTDIEKKLITLKGDIQIITQEYQKKLEQRDIYISKLEREIQFTKSELELSEDYKQLTQSSKKQRSPS